MQGCRRLVVAAQTPTRKFLTTLSAVVMILVMRLGLQDVTHDKNIYQLHICGTSQFSSLPNIVTMASVVQRYL